MSTMNYRTSLLCGICILMLAAICWADSLPEVVTPPASKEYLFYLDDIYSLNANIPGEDRPGSTAGRVMVKALSATITAAPTGMLMVPAVAFECQGTRYVVPSHQIVVLGPRPKQHGVFVETAPDPNGSGNVEVLIVINKSANEQEKSVWISYDKRPKDIEIVSQNTTSQSSDQERQWTMKVVLRNKSNQGFILKPELFQNMPEVKDWPLIEIPPAKPEV